MNNNKNELLKFLGGLALLVVGLFLLFNRVHVGSMGFDWGRMSFGRFSFPSGLIVVPFIIGIIWMFGSGGSFVSKIFTVLSILIIIAAIIANTSFWVSSMTMFDWLLILTMIFAGGTIVARTLFAGSEKQKSGDSSSEVKPAVDDKEYEEFRRAKKLKEELDEVKRNLDIDNQ